MWLVNSGAGPFGPISDADLGAMIRSGQLRDGWVAQAGTNNWVPLQQHPAFQAAMSGAAAAPPQFGAPQYAPPQFPPQFSGQAPMQPPFGAYGAPYPAPRRSSAGPIVGVLLAIFAIGGFAAYRVMAVRSVSTTTSGSGYASPPPANGPAGDPYADANKALVAVKAKFDRNFELQDKWKARPPESLKPLDNGPFSLTGTAPSAGIDYERVESIDSMAAVEYRFLDGLDTTTTKCALATSSDKAQTLEPESLDAIRKCKDFKYLVVVNVLALVKPQRTATGFIGGAMTANVFLFNIDTHNLLGGFAVSAKSSESVSFNANDFDGDTKALQKDLTDNLQRATADRWKALLKTDDFPRP